MTPEYPQPDASMHDGPGYGLLPTNALATACGVPFGCIAESRTLGRQRSGIHGELSRRGTGARQERRVPTLSELAQEIVTRGFQQASKDHHPDGKGHHEAQLLLTRARDELLNAYRNLPDDRNEESTMIMEAPEKPQVTSRDAVGGNWATTAR
jgi:hypothetical protein